MIEEPCDLHKNLFNLNPSKYFETYIKLSSDRFIFLNEDFTKETGAALTALLLYYDAQSTTDDITIYINSDGGDASALINIYDIMQTIEAPIQTVCLGRAYSAGAFLLAAGTKEKRFLMPHSSVMIHGIQCMFPMMGEEHPIDSKNHFKYLEANNDIIMKILAKHTGKTVEEVKADCAKDLYMDAYEAIDYGLADYILG